MSLLSWSPEGSRLVSGDQNGIVGVWQGDQRGRLLPVCHYVKKGAVSHLVFQTPAAGSMYTRPPRACPPLSACFCIFIMYRWVLGSVEVTKHTPLLCPPFFFAVSSGTIHVADDAGSCKELIQV